MKASQVKQPSARGRSECDDGAVESALIECQLPLFFVDEELALTVRLLMVLLLDINTVSSSGRIMAWGAI
ncbi:hypothetical protein BT69DRAFT_1276527 [Atractiella rhizophila]|nr:hypothetical protein BT69DRAFT_1283874 [Atractiella rhizophila]KAH8929256.1 hypothetical protein BT69DRAFT_1276527 [Atractiella rhizophila]